MRSMLPSVDATGRRHMRQLTWTRSPIVTGYVVWMLAGCLVLAGGAGSQAWAQGGSFPANDYFLAMKIFEDGEYRAAAKGFQSAARSGLRSADGRWIDSVCYYTMIGECLYHMGDYDDALDQYSSALKLFLSQRQWLMNVQFPDTNPPTYTGAPITWGAKARPTAMGPFPEKALSSPRALDRLALTEGGGILRQPQFVTLYAGEVARCITVALRRRAEILGPVGPHDPLTRDLIAGLSPSPAPPNHWTQAWVDCWLGMAYISANRPAEAAASLQGSLTAAGNFDHVLTSQGLVELGKLALLGGQFDQAGQYFFEATFPAAFYSQYDVIEEAFRWGSWNHLISGRPGVYPPLAPALQWAQRKSLRQLEVSLVLESSEQVSRGDVKAALALLETARRGMLRRDLSAGALGARHQFLLAKLNYQAANIAAGDTALAAAMKFYSQSAPVFQMSLADRIAGSITEHAADALYGTVLREPQPVDWALRPAETMALCLQANTVPWEHWFELSVKRNNLDQAVEIIDRIRRKQFFSATAMGGRLLALRWVLDGPKEALSEAAALQRQDLLGRYPGLQELARRSAELRTELATLPLVPTAEADLDRQTKAFAELAKISTAQELILREVAVGRNPCEFTFPPLMELKQVQAKLDEKQAIWLFFATSRDVYSFVIRKQGSVLGWRIPEAGKIRGGIITLLRDFGNYDGNFELSLKDTKSPWKTTANELFRVLTNHTATTTEPPWKDADELIIVPHGVLWYLPFEALTMPAGAELEPLLSKVRLRYAPFVSLSVPDGRRVSPIADTLLVAGKMHPQEADTLADTVATEMSAALPGVIRAVPSKIPSSLLATVSPRAVVYTEIEPKGGPLGWAPLPIDATANDSSLSAWLDLPWGAPQQLILPGFHTTAETALKKGGTGDEIFLAVSGLLASGSRSVLISRWRVGGESTRQLIREYLQELPHAAPANAWQRSVQLLRVKELDLEAEPRVNRSTFTEALKGEFPLFWAGYMLVDSGRPEALEPAVPAVPAPPAEPAAPGAAP